ncbi:MAG: GntR family transcriptional regulator [Rhodospirillales bacterium]|nr:GntR family transcriptional regulator [Rhodospirillales bacterium]
MKKSAFGVVQQASLVEQVRDNILAAIIKGELPPGDRLSESDLARRMGVSRGPVREAARLLEQRGFLRSEPRRGFFVRAVTINDIKNLHELRSCISIYAARKAKEVATAEDIQTLRGLYDGVCAVARGRDDPLAPLEANYAIHRFIFQLTGNPRYTALLEDILWEGRQIASLVNKAEDTSGAYFVETLLPLIDAFENGDAQSVGAAMGEFLQINHESVLEFFELHVDSVS